MRKSIFEQVKGFNEIDLKVAFNDVDLCLRIGELNLNIVWTPHANLLHHESASRGDEDTPEKQRRFESEIDYMMSRWGAKLAHDPAYNQNLTHGREDFSLNW
jgi:GT2 family glycosyltransferase